MAVEMGIPRNSPGLEANSGIALGSATISPIAMANAYATIANGGVHHDMFMVKKVTRASDNKVLYRAPKKTNRVLSEDLSADTSYALQQVVPNGTGQNAQALGRPAAGKTGTATNDDGDVSSSWFVGYTPQVATAVMYVRGKGNEALNGFLPSYFGANYPTYTWRAVMQAVLEGTEVRGLPAGRCSSTARRPTRATRRTRLRRSRPRSPSPKPRSRSRSRREPASPQPSQSPTQDPGNNGGTAAAAAAEAAMVGPAAPVRAASPRTPPAAHEPSRRHPAGRPG